ncbi:MAG: hypothetical protein QM811_23460 [Pirellulales bacterium]
MSPPSRSMRCAWNRAASTNCGSFSNTNACNGVDVAWRLTVHELRSAPSSVIIDGGGIVRFQKV